MFMVTRVMHNHRVLVCTVRVLSEVVNYLVPVGVGNSLHQIKVLNCHSISDSEPSKEGI